MDQANNQQPMSTPQLPPIPNFGGRKKTKFPILFLIGGISVLVVSILAAIFFIPKLQTNETSNGHVACTADAMICPDGSSVGRSGPNCEFAACPNNNNSIPQVNTPAIESLPLDVEPGLIDDSGESQPST